MRHLIKKTLLATVLISVSVGVFANDSDDKIRDKMIKESIASYTGNCPCPYFSDRKGGRCGKRSAYSRPGGASPLCYRSDISDEMVKKYKGN